MALKRFTAVLITLLFIFFISCKKDHRVLGTEVQPESDELQARSAINFPVYAHTVKNDSIVSFNTDLKYIGSNRDPNFGKMDIGLYLNASMDVSNLDFAGNTLVSAEIILAISNTNFIGKKDAVLNYSVFPLDSSLNPKRAYYTSNRRLHKKTQLLSNSAVTFSSFSNRQVIRIPIDQAFAQTVFSNPQYLTNTEAFQAQYKGFYIQADCGSNEGIIYQANLGDEVSGFYLRYANPSNPNDTVRRFNFSNSNNTASRFNTVQFDPLPTIKNQLNGDTTLGATSTFLKGMGVTRIKLQIPFLKDRSDSFQVAVSRAEVVLNVDPDFLGGIADKSSRVYNVPPKISLLAIDSLGREISTLDQRTTTYISRYDGAYDDTKWRYVFNIPLQAQAILRGQKKNYGFYLVMADPTPPYFVVRDSNFEGVIFKGSSQALRPVLNLSYVQFRNE